MAFACKNIDVNILAALNGATSPDANDVFVTRGDRGDISADQLAAITGAATPSSRNVFATMADIPPNELSSDQLAAITGATFPSATNVFVTRGDSGDVTADQVAAITGAASPSSTNVFATIADLPDDVVVPVDQASATFDSFTSVNNKLFLGYKPIVNVGTLDSITLTGVVDTVTVQGDVDKGDYAAVTFWHGAIDKVITQGTITLSITTGGTNDTITVAQAGGSDPNFGVGGAAMTTDDDIIVSIAGVQTRYNVLAVLNNTIQIDNAAEITGLGANGSSITILPNVATAVENISVTEKKVTFDGTTFPAGQSITLTRANVVFTNCVIRKITVYESHVEFNKCTFMDTAAIGDSFINIDNMSYASFIKCSFNILDAAGVSYDILYVQDKSYCFFFDCVHHIYAGTGTPTWLTANTDSTVTVSEVLMVLTVYALVANKGAKIFGTTITELGACTDTATADAATFSYIEYTPVP